LAERKAILNYTTEIAVEKTVAEIQGMLARQGARSILTDYDDEGSPTRISFLIKTLYGDQGFALPANIESVYKVMARQNAQGKIPQRFVTMEQAARVGWRIVKDWLEAQLAIIQTEMVTLDQIFLPYMTVGNQGQTMYELMKERQFLLPAGKEA
jgi:hypothetical protein